jgi:hypothetical protein
VIDEAPVGDPDEDEPPFLTVKQREGFGRYEGLPTSDELERFFFLDDQDRELIGRRRGDANRLGFALQLTTVRFLGTFLDDPLDVPLVVLDYIAAQLDVVDPSSVKHYLVRRQTRFEHRWEIGPRRLILQ